MGTFVLENIIWFILVIVSSAGLMWTFVRGGKILVGAQEAVLLTSRQGGLFVDLRSAQNFSTGHIPRSQNIPEESLAGRLSGLAEKYKDKPLVLVCQNGSISRRAIRLLQDKGFAQARMLSGGLNAWKEQHLPLFTGKASKGSKGN